MVSHLGKYKLEWKHMSPMLDEGWYLIDIKTDKTFAGPFPTDEEAQDWYLYLL